MEKVMLKEMHAIPVIIPTKSSVKELGVREQ